MIAVLDYGSQYTFLITRRLRELGFPSEILHPTQSPSQNYAAVILSGGPNSVDSTTQIPKWCLAKPILGICYGMQMLGQKLGASIGSGSSREFGKAQSILAPNTLGVESQKLLEGIASTIQVWMSHGDHVKEDSDQMIVLARSASGVPTIIQAQDQPWYGLQFHPEVEHTAQGLDLLRNFCRNIAQVKECFSKSSLVEQALAEVKPPINKILMAVSGGVDSTVAAKILTDRYGKDRVIPVFVDHGLLRHNEAIWVKHKLSEAGLDQLVVLDRKTLFLERLKGVTDPESKRKIIGQAFIDVFDDFVSKSREPLSHLGQGTLYTDKIESAGAGHDSAVIKSHHNVGGLPDHLNLKLIEPLSLLFKDEVRTLGRELGIHPVLLERHPFPGPGLAIRIMGSVDAASVDLLQRADHIFVDSLREAGLYEKTWQAFCVLLPVHTVGVMGDQRTYEKVLAIRVVCSSDGMTAEVANLPHEFLIQIAQNIVQNVKGINRVVYDITHKPPATIEWE